ncbi:MAG TPA: beta-eliminating lyase-related protein [Ktedonobacterales bacterium]|jgi:threonine aldolase
MDQTDRERIRRRCTRFLVGHYPKRPYQVLKELAEMIDPDVEADHYGEGEIVTQFEQEVAHLLGKEAAVFMPSGTMCQQIVLRLWADQRRIPRIAFHPTCHLELHEHQAYQNLHHLQQVLVGNPSRLMTLDDLQGVAEPLGALLLELPQREIGGQLPSWDELTAMIAWARERGIPTHLDGARLWQCRPFYQRDYAEIAALFDSVYVSFYKDLGALAGCVLAGPANIMAEARIWQRRHGGNLIRLYPYVLSARQGLRERLGRIAVYCAKAQEIANTLEALPQIEIVPAPPHTNMMHLFLRGEREKLLAAALETAEKTGIWLFSGLAPTVFPSYQRLEFTVGDASLDVSSEEMRGLFQALFTHASRS